LSLQLLPHVPFGVQHVPLVPHVAGDVQLHM
jgi:hypothetical protein